MNIEDIIREEIMIVIHDSLQKHEYYSKTYINKYNVYNDCFFEFIIDNLIRYTINLLYIESMMVAETETDEMSKIENTIVSHLIEEDEVVSEIKNIINEHHTYAKRELNTNEKIKKYFNEIIQSGILDENPNAKYDLKYKNKIFNNYNILSLEYLINDLNTSSDTYYFINDLSFLYYLAVDKKYLSSSKEYNSIMVQFYSKKQNTIKFAFKCRDQIREANKKNGNKNKNAKNYSRSFDYFINHYNKNLDKINEIINATNISKYEKVLLKTQFDNYVFNNFYSSLDSGLFDYLSNNINLIPLLYYKSQSKELYSSYTITVMQKTLFFTNLLRLLMLYNIDLEQLSFNCSPFTSQRFDDSDRLSLKNARNGFVQLVTYDQLLLLIFDILYKYFIRVGEIIASLMPNDENKSKENYIDELYDLIDNVSSLSKKNNNSNYKKISSVLPNGSKFSMKQQLLISYLFISTINQKPFYNINFINNFKK